MVYNYFWARHCLPLIPRGWTFARSKPQHVAAALEHLRVSREIHPLDTAPAEYITCTCLLAKAFHLMGELERSIQAYRYFGVWEVFRTGSVKSRLWRCSQKCSQEQGKGTLG